MPTLARSDCINSAMRRASGLYGRCTGIAQMSVSNPLGNPASASSFFAWSGSWGKSWILSSYDHMVGGIRFFAGWPAP